MDTIAKRIQKLLALANSQNEHESRAAAEKAQELLLRYNLSLGEVTQKEYANQQVETTKVRSIEERVICWIIQRHFFVDLVIDMNVKKGRGIRFLGTPVNVEIAVYVYRFLLREFRNCYRAHKKNHPDMNARDRKAYMIGLYKGLNDQLTAKREAVCQETGLVWVADPGSRPLHPRSLPYGD